MDESKREALAKALYIAKRKRVQFAGRLTWEDDAEWKRDEFRVIADDALAALSAMSEQAPTDV